MPDPRVEGPLARSAIEPAGPVRIEHGWQISVRRSNAALRVVDCSPLSKMLVRADEHGVAASALGVPRGTARRDADGVVIAWMAPGEWLVLGLPVPSATRARWFEQRLGARLETGPPRGQGQEVVSVVDMTHGLTLVQLTGARSAALLGKVCAIDLDDSVTPDRSAFRSLVAGVVTGVVRDDARRDDARDSDTVGERRYLLHCDRSVGQHLFNTLLDAGAEFGIEIDGFRAAAV